MSSREGPNGFVHSVALLSDRVSPLSQPKYRGLNVVGRFEKKIQNPSSEVSKLTMSFAFIVASLEALRTKSCKDTGFVWVCEGVKLQKIKLIINRSFIARSKYARHESLVVSSTSWKIFLPLYLSFSLRVDDPGT